VIGVVLKAGLYIPAVLLGFVLYISVYCIHSLLYTCTNTQWVRKYPHSVLVITLVKVDIF